MPIVGTVYKIYQFVSLIPSVSQILFSVANKIRPANAFFPPTDNLRPSPNTKNKTPVAPINRMIISLKRSSGTSKTNVVTKATRARLITPQKTDPEVFSLLTT